MNINIILLIVALAIIPIQICLSDQPLTDEEIKTYWNTLTVDEKLKEIRRLDMIEHAVPEITDIQFGAMLDNEGNLIVWPLSPLNLRIAYLEYDITLPNIYIEDFQEEESRLSTYILLPIIFTGVGITGTAIGGGRELWQYILSGSIGLAVGIVADIWLVG